MASIDHLHNEAKMLKVNEYLNLLASQYLASALRESHCMFETVTKLDDPRNLKETLQSAYYADVAPYLVDGIVPAGHYNNIKDQLHADHVRRVIESRQTNPVLGH